MTKLIAKQNGNAVAGDHALQALMVNFVTSSPQNAAKGQKIAAALAGIKQMAVDAFVKTFPGVSLDKLISEAKAARHQVEVLGSK